MTAALDFGKENKLKKEYENTFVCTLKELQS